MSDYDEELLDYVYQFINCEGYEINPDDLLDICDKFAYDENEIRAYLLSKQLEMVNVNDTITLSDDEYELFNFSESESEVDSDEEKEMEEELNKIEDIEVQKLDTYLIENDLSLSESGHLDNIYDSCVKGELSAKNAIEQLNNFFDIEYVFENFTGIEREQILRFFHNIEYDVDITDKEMCKKRKRESEDPVWLKEIKIEQQKTDLCLNKSNFKELVKEIASDYKSDLQFEPEVFEILQYVSEDFLIDKFEHSQRIAIVAHRDSIMPKDMHYANIYNN